MYQTWFHIKFTYPDILILSKKMIAPKKIIHFHLVTESKQLLNQLVLVNFFLELQVIISILLIKMIVYSEIFIFFVCLYAVRIIMFLLTALQKTVQKAGVELDALVIFTWFSIWQILEFKLYISTNIKVYFFSEILGGLVLF